MILVSAVLLAVSPLFEKDDPVLRNREPGYARGRFSGGAGLPRPIRKDGDFLIELAWGCWLSEAR